MDDTSLYIEFNGITHADANKYVEDLKNVILDAAPEIDIKRQRDNEETQDFGATLVLVLGTPAVIIGAKAIAKAIDNYGKVLALKAKGASLTIKTHDGTEIHLDGVEDGNKLIRVTDILAKLAGKH